MDPLEQIIAFLKQTDELLVASTLLKTFKKYSTEVEQYDQLGRLLNDVKDYHEAIDCAQRTLVLASNPHQMYAARSNLAKMMNHINSPDKALQYINANLDVNPDDYEAKMEQVFSTYLLGNLEKSYELTKQLLNDPNVPDNIRTRCLYNSGSYQMDEGNFKEGIRNFIQIGHAIGIWPNKHLPEHWQGQYVENATIAILAEGGIGDEIINVRFMQNIKDMGMDAIWVTNRDDLVELFNRNDFTTVRNISEITQENVIYCYSFFLPILLDLDNNQLWSKPYLKPSEEYVKKWENILPKGKKIALKYSGNPYYEQDLHRSVPLKELNNVFDFDRDDVTFISVQKEHNQDLANYPKIQHVDTQTLEDLLAVLSLMDYTVSSCTSIPHLSSAAGLPTIVMPPIATYYTWLNSGNDWYGNHVKVLRQREWKSYNHLDYLKTII